MKKETGEEAIYGALQVWINDVSRRHCRTMARQLKQLDKNIDHDDDLWRYFVEPTSEWLDEVGDELAREVLALIEERMESIEEEIGERFPDAEGIIDLAMMEEPIEWATESIVVRVARARAEAEARTA